MIEELVTLRQVVLAQKRACQYASPTAQQWAEGYEAALGWVLFRLEGLLLTADDPPPAPLIADPKLMTYVISRGTKVPPPYEQMKE